MQFTFIKKIQKKTKNKIKTKQQKTIPHPPKKTYLIFKKSAYSLNHPRIKFLKFCCQI